MPNAARQIEDIHFGTCSSLNNVTLDLAEWRDAFPRLKTIWAYEKSAGTGAAADQREWERQTRGRTDALTMTPGMQQKLVATWSAHDGKVRGLGPYAELADKRTAAWRRLNEAFRGGSTDPRTLEADYRLFRELAQRSELDEKERVVVRQSADQALRLRYYSDVAARFQRAHAAEISAAYRAAGLPVPDFSRLSRAEARDVIKRFVTSKLEGDYPPAIEATRTLLTNFDSLDSRVIPDAWCQHETQTRRH
jgi:hypothetical protein